MISPLMLKPKLIIQELWRRNLTWDEQLPEDIKQRWIAWKKKIPTLAKIKIPRWYRFTATVMGQLELHVFSDASQCAYGAVAYSVAYPESFRCWYTSLGTKLCAQIIEKCLK